VGRQAQHKQCQRAYQSSVRNPKYFDLRQPEDSVSRSNVTSFPQNIIPLPSSIFGCTSGKRRNGRSAVRLSQDLPFPYVDELYSASSEASSYHALCPLDPLLVLFFDFSHARVEGGFGVALSFGGFCLQSLHLGFGLVLDLLRPLPGLLQLLL